MFPSMACARWTETGIDGDWTRQELFLSTNSWRWNERNGTARTPPPPGGRRDLSAVVAVSHAYARRLRQCVVGDSDSWGTGRRSSAGGGGIEGRRSGDSGEAAGEGGQDGLQGPRHYSDCARGRRKNRRAGAWGRGHLQKKTWEAEAL
jgi:hypothetical protein